MSPMTPSITEIVTQVLEVMAALAAAPLFLGWVNQCRAWLANRRAPSIWVPYYNIRKLFDKDAVLAENASPLFRIAPYIVFGTMVVAAGIIPAMGTRLPLVMAADAIALVGLFATARVFLSLADGFAALLADLRAKFGGSHNLKPESTLLDLFNCYAPAGDANNPSAYTQFVCGWTSHILGRSVTPSTTLRDFWGQTQ